MYTYKDIYSFIVNSWLYTIDDYVARQTNVCDWMHFIATNEYYYYTMF